MHWLTEIAYCKESQGAVKVSYRSYGCDQEGRRLSWETGVEEVGFKVFPT